MTNNPTIDGVLVPRKLLKCYLSGDGGDWVEAGHELRALLDAKAHPCQVLLDGCDGSCAPAVERQEPVAFRFKWDYDHGNGWCRGAIRFVETMEEVDHEDKSTWRDITPLYEVAPEVAALQSTIDQLEDKLNKAIDLDFQRREAIEQLQARVQELESGRVDGIWFPRELGDGLAELIAEKARVCGGGAFDIWEEICERFGNATPAPVAVGPEPGSPAIDHLRRLLEIVVNPGSYPVKVLHNQIRATLATMDRLDATAAPNQSPRKM